MSPQRAARRHTRWLVAVPVLGLLVMWGGAWLLERAGPRADVTGMIVEVPPLAIPDEPTTCTRQGQEATIREIRESLPDGGRVSSGHIVLCPSAYDQRQVTYVGEVVGELLRRPGGAWAQVNDDDYALETGPIVAHREHSGFNAGMSVWLPDGRHEQIEGVGRPNLRGDVLLIEGRVFRADPDDGGGLTIRADQATVIAPYQEIDDPLHLPQAITAGVLALLTAGALVWSRQVRHR